MTRTLVVISVPSTCENERPRRSVTCPGRAHHRATGGEMAKSTCTIEGCDRYVAGLGLCSMHWQRNKRRGHPGAARPERSHDVAASFLARTEVDPDSGCWRWTGSRTRQGYGHVRMGDRDYQTHVLAYVLIIGPVPEGRVLDHECHNRDLNCDLGAACPHRACWNPAHLIPRTVAENCARGRKPGRKRQPTCRTCGWNDWYLWPRNGARQCNECRRRREQVARANGIR